MISGAFTAKSLLTGTNVTFVTEQAAKDLSAAEATARGCSGGTLYWYGWREDVSGNFHVICDDDKLAIRGQMTHSRQPVFADEKSEDETLDVEATLSVRQSDG